VLAVGAGTASLKCGSVLGSGACACSGLVRCLPSAGTAPAYYLGHPVALWITAMRPPPQAHRSAASNNYVPRSLTRTRFNDQYRRLFERTLPIVDDVSQSVMVRYFSTLIILSANIRAGLVAARGASCRVSAWSELPTSGQLAALSGRMSSSTAPSRSFSTSRS
jgi:hypothetical protein